MKISLRNAIKGFVGVSLVAASFLCGFTFDALRDAPRNATALRYTLETVPSTTLSRLLRPNAAQASATDTPPGDIYEATLRALREQYCSGNTTGDEDRLSPNKLTYAAIDGMLQTIGDRYTEFYTPTEYRRMLEDQSGNFVGIGARLEPTKDKRVMVLEPLEGSPAAQAGLLNGDIIIAVDDKKVIGQPMDAVIALIRGDEGTPIKITVDRKGKALSFRLKRALVQSPVVEWRMEDETAKIGYVRLAEFNEQSDIQFDAAIQKLERKGMKGLIFDLRDNGGGLLNIAQDLASRFLREGAIVWVQEKSGRLSSLNVEIGKHHGKLSTGAYPIVVLVNGNSASASEIVCGALQDSHIATLVGNRTFGKGLVQTIFPLGDDSAVKITTQHYFTRDKHDINSRKDPDGHTIPGSGGIIPNYVVDFTPADAEACREVLRRDPQNKAAANRLDPQLQKGLAIVRERLKGP